MRLGVQTGDVDECGVCGGLGATCALALALTVDVVAATAGAARDLGEQVKCSSHRHYIDVLAEAAKPACMFERRQLASTASFDNHQKRCGTYTSRQAAKHRPLFWLLSPPRARKASHLKGAGGGILM